MMTEEKKITILHFNDVYNIESRDKEPVGGAARFATALKSRKHLNPMVIFSGDAFNPSIMSSVFNGKQMVAVLNELDVDLAVYGNHDFDFGVDKTVKLAGETKFPWLLSNVLDNFTGKPLAEGKPTHMMEWDGKKIGFIGLVENDWIATLSSVDSDDVTYIDFVTLGRSLAQELRDEGADYVIALTHMRWPNDERLAREVDGIDLVLGGHDHDFNYKQVNGKYVIKSGTDFRFLGHITLDFKADGKVDVDIDQIVIDKTFDEDERVKEIVESFSEKLVERMNKVLGEVDVDLEGRFSEVRTKETNLGNFISDIMLNSTKADCALLNAGTLRSDMIHCQGAFKTKDLVSILPFGGSVGVLEVTGKQLLQALEVGVSAYPSFEGRFPQVAGMTFGFDPTLPPMERVESKYVKVQGEDLDLEKKYTLAVTDFLAMGKDGYDLFDECPAVVSYEEGPVLHSIIKNHFASVKVCRGEKKLKYAHHQAILAINRMKALVKLKDALNEKEENGDKEESADKEQQEEAEQETTSNVLGISDKSFGVISKIITNMRKRRRAAFSRQNTRQEVEREALPCAVAPKVEGRIFILTTEKRQQLDLQRESDLGES